jgi:phosphoglycerate kinase
VGLFLQDDRPCSLHHAIKENLNVYDKLTIQDVDVRGKKVFVRVDFNVPVDKHANITDDSRIRAVLPTINYLLDEGAAIILASHMGRPKGEVKEEFSLAPIAKRLQRLLSKEIILAPDCVGEEVDRLKADLKPEEILLLENLRFHKEEQKNDEDFAKELAKNVDVYIDDAFATAHRAHASIDAITRFIGGSETGSCCAAGFLMKKELEYFNKSMEDPKRPFVAIVGGAKVSSKMGVLKNLLERVDKVIIGGGMAFTFLKTLRYSIGKSIVEDDMLDTAYDIVKHAKENGVKLYLPVDCVVADKFKDDAETKVTTVQDIPDDWYALDIGPATTMLFKEAIQDAKTIIWNGPMGVFEMDAFSRGTYSMVSAVAASYSLTIVGGGDTDVAIHKAGETNMFSYISTGGGAFLELLEGKMLPGIAALSDKPKEEIAYA